MELCDIASPGMMAAFWSVLGTSWQTILPCVAVLSLHEGMVVFALLKLSIVQVFTAPDKQWVPLLVQYNCLNIVTPITNTGWAALPPLPTNPFQILPWGKIEGSQQPGSLAPQTKGYRRLGEWSHFQTDNNEHSLVSTHSISLYSWATEQCRSFSISHQNALFIWPCFNYTNSLK